MGKQPKFDYLAKFVFTDGTAGQPDFEKFRDRFSQKFKMIKGQHTSYLWYPEATRMVNVVRSSHGR
jgi:hypothetical protein